MWGVCWGAWGVCVGCVLGVCGVFVVWGVGDVSGAGWWCSGEKVSLAALLSGYLGKSGHLPRCNKLRQFERLLSRLKITWLEHHEVTYYGYSNPSLIAQEVFGKKVRNKWNEKFLFQFFVIKYQFE